MRKKHLKRELRLLRHEYELQCDFTSQVVTERDEAERRARDLVTSAATAHGEAQHAISQCNELRTERDKARADLARIVGFLNDVLGIAWRSNPDEPFDPAQLQRIKEQEEKLDADAAELRKSASEAELCPNGLCPGCDAERARRKGTGVTN